MRGGKSQSLTGFTLGVEEEFHVVDSETGRIRFAGPALAEHSAARTGRCAEPEMLACQVESSTPVCRTLGDVRSEVLRMRREVSGLAAEAGCRLIASGTYPACHATPAVTPKRRYQEIVEAFGLVAREQLVCGCHVHVGVDDAEVAIAAMNRVRPWLAVLLALSANSPFWRDEDTGYASFRTQVWSQWPASGPPGAFSSRTEYDKVMRSLVDAGVLLDLGMLYWDVRPSQRFDTLEFRIADVCLTADETVLIAGLIRALTATCVEAARRDEPVCPLPHELLRAAHWQASRFGLGGNLIDPVLARPVPAASRVHDLLAYVRPALKAFGDFDEVRALTEQTLAEGTGADRQRKAFGERNSLAGVFDLLTVR